MRVELMMALVIDGELAEKVMLDTDDQPARLWHEAHVALGNLHALEVSRRGGDKGEGAARDA